MYKDDLFNCNIVHYSNARHCQKTVEISGVTIPKGATVQLPIHLLHYNPEFWPEPEKFDPERYCSLSSFLSDPPSICSSLTAGLPLRRRQSDLLSATCLSVGDLATVLE